MTGLALGIVRPSAAAMLAGGVPIKPSLDLDFANVRYQGAALSDLSVTRASSGMAQKADGSWISFPPNVPRITDKGLLVEEARTNAIRNNTMQGAVVGGAAPTNWLLRSATSGLSTAVEQILVDRGVDSIDLRFSGTTTASATQYARFEPGQGIAASQSQVWTFSLFVELVSGVIPSGTGIALNVYAFNSSSIQVGGSFGSAVDLSQGRTRVSLTTTLPADASVAAIVPQFTVNVPSGREADFTIRIGLPQLELGAFATSPIRTTGASAVRAADRITTPIGSWFNANAGTLYGEFEGSPLTAPKNFGILTLGTYDNGYQLFSGSGAVPVFRVSAGAASQAYLSATTQDFFAVNGVNRIAGAYALNDFARVARGGLLGTDTEGSLPTVSGQAGLGYTSALSELGGYLRRVAYFPVRLPNAQLQALTS
jgi:hypothetical protein